MFIPFKEKTIRRKVHHVAISLEGGPNEIDYYKEFKAPVEELFERKGKLINALIEEQIRLDIPVMSLFILSGKKLNSSFSEKVKLLKYTLKSLNTDLQVKVMPIGKWYELPVDLLDTIKKFIEITKEHNKFFLNLYINYDGQNELLDATKILIRKIENNKISFEQLSKQEIKDNLYSSYFPPPDLMIINDSSSTNGFLLWDSSNSDIIITHKKWTEFSPQDFNRIVRKW